MRKLYEKIIAIILTILLSSTNLLVIGSYGITYALSDSELSNQTTETNNSNVEFNAYFENNIHTKTVNASETTELFINIKVKNVGYLSNAQIMLQNVNYKINENIQNEYIQSVDKENNKILLKQLNNGSNITIEIPISILDDDNVSLDNFSKEFKAVLTGTYVDGEAKENRISKEIFNKLYWKGTAEVTIEGKLTKYIPYNIDEKFGVIIQAKIETGILNSTLPIKQTQINVSVPQINNKKPTSVNVIANNTKATNGKEDGVEFNEQNYTYNSESGIIIIEVANAQNTTFWLKNVKDEYLVNFIFEDKDTYDYVIENKLNTSSEIEAKIQVYNNEPTTITKNVTIEMRKEEKIGNITDFEILALEYISKGQLYANYEAENKKETSYIIHYGAIINDAKLIDKISLTQSIDELEISSNSSPLTLQNCVYNKKVIVSQKMFNKILGEDGSIKIYNKDNEKISTIDKTTNKDQDGNYVIDISEKNESEILIETSKPICEGKIIIDIEKAIKTNFPYTKQQLKDAVKLNTKIEGKTNELTIIKSVGINLKELKNVVELSINKNELSNVVENENVEIRATLDTSNLEYALYKNPTLKITLPDCISKLKLNSYDILMNNGLIIKNVRAENKNGVAVISIELEGTQTEYTLGAEYKGTIILINTNITVKPLTPTVKENIVMEYSNENLTTESVNTIETEVKFIAPTEIMLAHGISNYKENAQELSSTVEETITAEVEAYSEERTSKIYGKIVNNYNNSIENIKILGRFPVEGTKQIEGSTSLGSTFSMKISNITLTGIESTKYTIYYSEKGEATDDITNSYNDWKTTKTENTKSYLIVTKEYRMNQGEKIEFSYNATIPKNLSFKKDSYEIFKLYFDNNSSIGTTQEQKKSSIIKLTTGEGPNLVTTITPMTKVIREGQIVKMKVSVSNTGNVEIKNAKISIPVPKYADFMEFCVASGFAPEKGEIKTYTFESIKPNETFTESYYIKINNKIDEIDTSENKRVTVKYSATAKADNIEGEIQAQDCIVNILEGTIGMGLISDISEEQTILKNNEIRYQLKLENITEQKKIENIDVTIPLPKGVICTWLMIENETRTEEELKEVVKYDVENNILKVNLDEIQTVRRINFKLLVKEINDNIIVGAEAVINNNNAQKHYSNIIEYETEKIKLEVSKLEATPEYVKEGEKIEYKFKITNLGNVDVNAIKIQDALPEEIKFEKIEYLNKEQNTGYSINFTINDIAEILIGEPLKSKETIYVTITGTAKTLQNKNTKKIENEVIILGDNFNEIKTNKVTNYIEYNNKLERPENEGNETSISKITGTAWLDDNKNGKRDENELVLSNVDVLIINKNNNKIVQDIYTGEEKRVKTNSQGQYEIDNLPKGEYIVVFLYNSSIYNITKYKAEGVGDRLNCDAIEAYVTLDGKRNLAGMTDAITISGNNINYIDIGLYKAEKFDLKLEKYITKTTLSTPTIGTKISTYDNKKITKIEVLKDNLGKSSVIVEYTIVITNQGSVPGYVKKIVDYLPKNVTFYSELNKDWYLSENGNVYNSSLANTIINPGESKEVKIILSKVITESSLGNLSNTAEIYESYNELGLKDINSKDGNKVEYENDISKAEIVLSVVTGNKIIYPIISLIVISIITFGVIQIKRKILNKK